MLKHLQGRFMDVSLYPGMGVEENCACFPLWNLSGQMVGYQTYRPDMPKIRGRDADPRDMKYYTYVSRYFSLYPALAVWGLETYHWPGPLFLTEGIFDACRLHSAGLPAIAVISSDPKPLRPWLFCLVRPVISVVQGDAAGKKLAKYGDSAIYLPQGQDVGELTNDQFDSYFGWYRQGPSGQTV